MDHQVKIRGYRIELGEIESAIRGYEGIKQVIVVVKERGEDKRLVGYYVEEEGKEVRVEELKRYLRGKLPEYMVPNQWVILKKIPLTPNGKVDRKGLPEPEGRMEGKEYVGPRDAVEEAMVEIWQEVLGVEKVGIHDDFFEIGGHSLLATQLISRVRNVFKVEMTLKEMFENKSVAEFSRSVEKARLGGGQEGTGKIKLVDRTGKLGLSYAQERLWFLDKYEPNSAFYNVPFVLRMEGELKEKALEGALNEIVRRHEALRTRFEEKEGVPEQVVEEAVYRGLEVLEVGDEGEAKRVIEEESAPPI